MVVCRFQPLWTFRIIVWTVKGGSTPTIGAIIPVKGIVVPRVADLTFGITCVVPGLLIIAHCVTASFTVSIVNAIMWWPSNVNRLKPVSSAKPSTRSFPTNATSVGTPNVPCVTNGCPSMTISVTFNLSQRRRRGTLRNLQKSQRGEVAWWRHPLQCLSMRISRLCRMPRGSLSLICCAISLLKKRLSMCCRVRIVPYNFFVIWMTWSMCRTVMKRVRSLWCFTTWRGSMACLFFTNSTSNNERWWTNWRWGPKSCLSRADPSNSLTRCVSYPWPLSQAHSTWQNWRRGSFRICSIPPTTNSW